VFIFKTKKERNFGDFVKEPRKSWVTSFSGSSNESSWSLTGKSDRTKGQKKATNKKNRSNMRAPANCYYDRGKVG